MRMGRCVTRNSSRARVFKAKSCAAAVADRVARELKIGSTAEMPPDESNRIVADFDRRDAAGVPRPRIFFKIDDYAKRGLRDAIPRHERIFAALGASEMRRHPPTATSAVILGTARMGRDAKTSVVDAELRAHEHDNLFIVGGANFTTGGVLTPTLTIAALALQAAKTIEAALSGR